MSDSPLSFPNPPIVEAVVDIDRGITVLRRRIDSPVIIEVFAPNVFEEEVWN